MDRFRMMCDIVSGVKKLGLRESAVRFFRSGEMRHLTGHEVGRDSFGNIYYKSPPGSGHWGLDRWVWYASWPPDPTMVDPLWHSWIHRIIDDIPPSIQEYVPAYKRDRIPNRTSTFEAYTSPHYIGNREWNPSQMPWSIWKQQVDPSSSPVETTDARLTDDAKKLYRKMEKEGHSSSL